MRRGRLKIFALRRKNENARNKGEAERPPHNYRSQAVTTKYLAVLGIPLVKTVARAGP